MKKTTAAVLLSIAVILGAFIGVCADSISSRTVKIGCFFSDDIQESRKDSSYAEYEYCLELEQYADLNFEFVKVPFSEAFDMLENGQVDILNGIVKNPNLEGRFDFSEGTTGSVQSKIYARLDNDELYFGSVEKLNGKRIGFLNGCNYQQFDEYSAENGFSAEKYFYDDAASLENALANDEVDAIYTAGVRDVQDCKVIVRFSSEPLYFAVRKNDALMNDINKAMRKLSEIYPSMNNKAFSGYYKPSFTPEEAEYINSQPYIKVSYDPNWRPIEYYDEDEKRFMGIAEDVFDMIEKYSGLNFSYEKTNNYTETLNKFEEGSIDVLVSMPTDYERAKARDAYITMPYLESTVVELGRKNDHDKVEVIAVPKNSRIIEKIERDYPNSEKIYYNSIEECMKAVRSRKADALFTNNYTADFYLTRIDFSSMCIKNVTNYTEKLSVAVSKKSNPQLLSIINKSILCVSELQMQKIIVSNSVVNEDNSIKNIIYNNPYGAVMVIVIVAGCIIGYMMIKIRRSKRSREVIKKALSDVEITNERFKVMMKYVPCEVMEYDLYMKSLYWIDRRTGDKIYLPFDNPKELDKEIRETVYPSMVQIVPTLYDRMMSGDMQIVEIMEGYRSNGDKCWGRLTAIPVYNKMNMPVQAVCVIEDITDTMEKSKELEGKLNETLKSTYDGVYEINLAKDTFTVLYEKEIYLSLSNVYSEAVEEFTQKLVAPNNREFFRVNMSSGELSDYVIAGNKNMYFESEIWNKEMQVYRHSSFTVTKGTWDDNVVLMFMRDIEEQIQERRVLIEKSQKDNLTGLYNKLAFFEECEAYIKDTDDTNYAVLFMDLDNFKQVNDYFGHIKGDEAIQLAADKLRLIFSNLDIVSRFGGDEFCVLVKNIPDNILTDKLEWSLEKLREEYSDEGRSVRITASIGAAKYERGADFMEMLNRADKALYSAKENGKDRYVIYTPDIVLEGYVGRQN